MAVDQRTVEAQLRALGDFHQWGTKKEVRHLPAVLNSGETIRAVTSGVYQGNTWLVTAGTRLAVYRSHRPNPRGRAARSGSD
jgi:hypothetical protein